MLIIIIIIIIILFVIYWLLYNNNNNQQFTMYSNKLTINDITNLKIGQFIMTNMFRIFNKICRKYNIKYWCMGGTLIGVMRHKGWIPWDGDIDISMLQEDYIIFQGIIQKELPNDLWFQDKNTDINYKSNIGKIRHLHSSYSDYDNHSWHNGLQIDIFIYKNINNMLIPNYNEGHEVNYNEGHEVIGSYDIIFPLKEMYFEDIFVYIPNKYEQYSINTWGSYPPSLVPVNKRYPHEGAINPYSISKKMKKKYSKLYI